MSTAKNPFRNFFADGSEGLSLFKDYIRSYLTVEDLILCSSNSTGGFHGACHTYTLRELLDAKKISLPYEMDRIYLASIARHQVRKDSPRQKHLNARRSRLDRVEPQNRFDSTRFHPDEVEGIYGLTEQYLSHWKLLRAVSCPETTDRERGDEDEKEVNAKQAENDIDYQQADLRERLRKRRKMSHKDRMLISARYADTWGNSQHELATYDVTDKIRKLARVHGDGYLHMYPPPRQAKKVVPWKSTDEPRNLCWWYNRLFGDPVPFSTKTLILTVAEEDQPGRRDIRYGEGDVFSMKLCVDPSKVKRWQESYEKDTTIMHSSKP